MVCANTKSTGNRHLFYSVVITFATGRDKLKIISQFCFVLCVFESHVLEYKTWDSNTYKTGSTTLKEWTTPDSRNTPSITILEEEEILDVPGKEGSASMPEHVKRPNPWRKKMMMMMMHSQYFSIISVKIVFKYGNNFHSFFFLLFCFFVSLFLILASSTYSL